MSGSTDPRAWTRRPQSLQLRTTLEELEAGWPAALASPAPPPALRPGNRTAGGVAWSRVCSVDRQPCQGQPQAPVHRWTTTIGQRAAQKTAPEAQNQAQPDTVENGGESHTRSVP